MSFLPYFQIFHLLHTIHWFSHVVHACVYTPFHIFSMWSHVVKHEKHHITSEMYMRDLENAIVVDWASGWALQSEADTVWEKSAAVLIGKWQPVCSETHLHWLTAPEAHRDYRQWCNLKAHFSTQDWETESANTHTPKKKCFRRQSVCLCYWLLVFIRRRMRFFRTEALS